MTALYRYFNSVGKLLYVGISSCPFCRLKSHRCNRWFGSVVNIKIEHFKTREAAAIAELSAIKSENPIHNFKGTGRPKSSEKKSRLSPVKIYNLVQSRKPFFVETRRERKSVLTAGKFCGVRVVTRALNNGFQVGFLEQ